MYLCQELYADHRRNRKGRVLRVSLMRETKFLALFKGKRLLICGLVPCVPKGIQQLAVSAQYRDEQNSGYMASTDTSISNTSQHKRQAGLESAQTSMWCSSCSIPVQ